MTDADRKLLTEYLDECDHKIDIYGECAKCCLTPGAKKPFLATHTNRAFDTGQDLYDLYRKMVEKRDWFDFCEWSAFDEGYGATNLSDDYQGWSDWLFHVDRIPLIVEWLKGKEGK